MGMQANELCKHFVKLVRIADMQCADYKQELLDYAGGNADVLQCYVLEDEDDADVIDIDTLRSTARDVYNVDTLMMNGDSSDRRCWGNKVQVYETETGVYMDYALYDLIFA